MAQSTYIWYSPATDVTGKKLMEALDASGGTTKPTANKDVVICWGTKTEADVVMANKKIFNHPNNIRNNRNKLKALDLLKNGAVNVANFSDNFKLAGTKDFPFPIIARTKFHQGGAGFWLCLTAAQVAQAVKDGAQYFQTFIDIKDEYRLHVVNGEVIYGVRKVQRDNHAESFIEHYTEHVEDKATKGNVKLDKDTVKFVMDKLARKFATGPDMIIRSNTRGWKFSKVADENLNKDLVAEAVKAVKALGLDYAAVDCCIDSTGKVFIIECNSGPGLDGTSFDAWSTAFKKLLAPKVVPAAPVAPKVVPAAPVEKVAGAAAKMGVANAKQRLKERVALLSQLAEVADDNDAEVLEKLLKKANIN